MLVDLFPSFVNNSIPWLFFSFFPFETSWKLIPECLQDCVTSSTISSMCPWHGPIVLPDFSFSNISTSSHNKTSIPPQHYYPSASLWFGGHHGFLNNMPARVYALLGFCHVRKISNTVFMTECTWGLKDEPSQVQRRLSKID